MSVFVIAEIGVNHNGRVHTAFDMIDAAKQAGADAAKFQLFKDRPEIEHLRLREGEILTLAEYCTTGGIEFMCTPFYLEAVAFLDPLVKRHKAASGWWHKREFMHALYATGKPLIVSTGMIDEVPGSDMGAMWEEFTDGDGHPEVTLLHCVSQYPCPDNDARLRLIHDLQHDFSECGVGYSDHTTGITACIAAAGMGAQIIEKHFTFDKTQPGPDHSCSAEPEEFAEMVRHIRRIERML